MILQNDTRIAKGPPLFKRYQRGAMTAQDAANPMFGTGAPASGEGEGAGGTDAAPPGAAEDSGVAIAFAGAGFLFAKSATVNPIARSIGNRTVPLLLSIQA